VGAPRRPLLLTYHAIEDGPAPLCIRPALFRHHVACIVASGRRTVTVSQLAAELGTDGGARELVALTFDDGTASAARVAAPLLMEAGLVATIFCVAGYLGRPGTWPSLPPQVAPLELAGAQELATLAAQGFELGSHGLTHAALGAAPAATVHHEVVVAKQELEAQTGADVTSFAYPYGSLPQGSGRAIVERTYEAACVGSNRVVGADADRFALPRIDAHYFRSPRRLGWLLDDRWPLYLGARRTGGRVRRWFASDFTPD
jgi:peptidoglycan/xylan/chitin deacetylase (PgdA/CDA1 family)